MADVLYGADLGAVATDVSGNVKDGQTFTVFSDPQGANVFTLTKAVASNLTPAGSTAGVVTATPLGRIMFYAQDTDSTLWLKNGSNVWGVNPVNLSSVVAARIAAAVINREDVTDSLNLRLDAVETTLASVPTTTVRPWSMWRARLGSPRTTTTGNYTSLTFSSAITTNPTFSVSLNNDALSVSVAGWYRITLRTGWSFNSTGVRSGLILINIGATTMDTATAPSAVSAEDDRAPVASAATTTSISEDFYLTPTDSVLLVVRQTSGGPLDVNNGRHLTSASLEYLGSA